MIKQFHSNVQFDSYKFRPLASHTILHDVLLTAFSEIRIFSQLSNQYDVPIQMLSMRANGNITLRFVKDFNTAQNYSNLCTNTSKNNRAQRDE